MARPPAARAKILDAYTTILIDEGERAATIEAVAAAAGVSKGGLLYHFGSKEALVDGLAARLSECCDDDLAAMHAAPEGAAAYYIRTSLNEDLPFDRTIIAMARLSQGENTRAQQALARVHEQSLAALTDELGDASIAKVVALLGDGLYYQAALTGIAVQPDEVAELLTVVEQITASRS